MEVKEILRGFYKLAVEEATEVQLENIARCHSCTLFDNGYCSKKRTAVHIKTGQTVNGCGCYVPAKARSNSECPLGKWLT